MDQFISANGVAGNALAIDTRALTAELAPIPDGLRLVVCNSMVRHSVAGGEYAQVRREVEEAAAAIGRLHPGVKQLRDAGLGELDEAKGTMSHEAFLRGRHVITDSQRVLDGVAALRAGDVGRFGKLMDEAHVSFRDDFGASCEECDLLVELAQALPGCLGSRLTGGGFGGCTVSLVEAEAAEGFAAKLQAEYKQRTGVTADIFVCAIADGAGEVLGG
jgi:galactokinase